MRLLLLLFMLGSLTIKAQNVGSENSFQFIRMTVESMNYIQAEFKYEDSTFTFETKRYNPFRNPYPSAEQADKDVTLDQNYQPYQFETFDRKIEASNRMFELLKEKQCIDAIIIAANEQHHFYWRDCLKE